MKRSDVLALVFCHSLLLAACEPSSAPPRPPTLAAEAGAPISPVDSVIPMEEAMRRFRADLPAAPRVLEGGFASRQRLAEAVVRALAQEDTSALAMLAVNRAEFAYLYYPDAPLSRPPYELPPAVAWFQMQQANRTGALRALGRFGGRPWRLTGLHCAGEPVAQGRNRVWSGCRVEMQQPGGPVVGPLRLFGAILERDGRFKLLSFDNDL